MPLFDPQKAKKYIEGTEHQTEARDHGDHMGS